MYARKRLIIFIVFILLIFALLTYQGTRGGTDASNVPFLNSPFIILEQGLSNVVNGVKKIFHKYIFLVGLEEENRKLMTEINKQMQEYNEYQEATLENERLRSLLKLKKQRSDYVATAEVFGRDPTNWFQVLWINKGKDHGITKDMVAVTHFGIVGKIHKVFNNVASIILISDVSSSVAARVQTSRIEGILEGRGTNKCYLKYVPQDVVISKGDKVITSGRDGIYPAGLQIGYISDIEKKPRDFFQFITITTSQNLQSVEEVLILKR
jgi:rod shape-determining protein MreC